jgi:prepilin-type N-terminal cleavage/methylation domain-containing protein
MHGLKRAFTLVEAILTIAIMGILAMVILPHFVKEGFIGNLTFRSATSQIASDIRYTRQLAVTNSGYYLIRFDFNQREYKIYKGSALPANQVGETKEIPEDVNCSGTNQFDCDYLGGCNFNGTGLLISEGANQNRILVDTPTGAVIIEKIS